MFSPRTEPSWDIYQFPVRERGRLSVETALGVEFILCQHDVHGLNPGALAEEC